MIDFNNREKFNERINSKMLANIQNIDRLLMPQVIFEKLPDFLEELNEELKADNKEGVRDNLRKITILAYLTNGNGIYLYEKGEIEV